MGLQITGYCLRCSACRAWCPYGAIQLEADRLHIDPELCDGCGRCLTACPNEAIVPVAQPLIH